MFTGYFDASGGTDTGVMAVAGFVADSRKWQEFEPSWRLVLAKYHLPYFHMNEFAPSQGIFSSWRGDETRRASLLRDLIQVVGETAEFWVCCSVRTVIFDEVKERYPVIFEGGAYPLVARISIALSHNIMRARHGVADIQHVFESGDQGKGQLVGMIERLNAHTAAARARGIYDPRADPYPIPIPIFKPSRDTATEKGLLPLQAADLAAWEFHKLHREAALNSRRVRRSIRELSRRIPGDHKVLNVSGLMEICELTGIRPK